MRKGRLNGKSSELHAHCSSHRTKEEESDAVTPFTKRDQAIPFIENFWGGCFFFFVVRTTRSYYRSYPFYVSNKKI